MEEFRFINRVWISVKGKALDKALLICACIAIPLELVSMAMDGITLSSSAMLLVLVIMAGWARTNRKRQGHYTECECVLRLGPGKMRWEYPSIDMTGGGKKQSIVYLVEDNRIDAIQLSMVLKSIRVICRPVIEKTDKNKKTTIVDCGKKDRQCALILYNDQAERIGSLMEKYLNHAIEKMEG